MNPTNPILNKLMANKHTTGAGLFFIFCLAASQIAKAWIPSHFAEIDKTLDALKELAVGYGFLMAGDGSGTPPDSGTHSVGTGTAKTVGLAALGILAIGLISGCAPLAPGADPIVVRTEQVETDAFHAFDFVVHLDATLAASAETNAQNFKALHTTANWLRAPSPAGTNTIPRGAALIYALDQVKLDYIAGKASSNTLSAILTTTEGLAVQCWSWKTNFN